MKRLHILICVLGLVILAVVFKPYVWAAISPVVQKFKSSKTVDERLQQYGNRARTRLAPFFANKKIAYPPARIALVGLKQENILEVYAADGTNAFQFIRFYPIRAASSVLGPKLREGDGQVPEGIYRIESLNPNSRFHLSLRIGYPNSIDREHGQKEGRTNLGGDIMIHGNSVSVGCLAMGDEAAEDLFVMAADSGLKNITVILSPVDFRLGKTVPKSIPLSPWTESLYDTIRAKLNELPKKANEGR